jgi:hypothetical protein
VQRKQHRLHRKRQGEKKKRKGVKFSKSQKNSSTFNSTIVTSGPNTDLINTPIEECTPLSSIPGSLLVTSAGLGFEGAVVVVGDYYYNHKTREIEKRMSKRKIGKVDVSHETPERNIKWKVGPDLKDNNTSSLST